ncbi:MAG: ATP-binding protein [Bacteroidetes bacterium]|nr:ATP-binding protein [Bacteroidota bacterium]
MQYVTRFLQAKIESAVQAGKVLLLYGARRVGKTILLEQIRQSYKNQVLMMNGEDNDTLKLLEDRSISNYRRLLENINLLIIDEAQQIPEIGMKLKLMIDEIPGLCIIASGSSAYQLLHETMEALTGRCKLFPIYPLSQMELSIKENLLETRQNLEERLIFGSYPEVIVTETIAEKRLYLANLMNAYLFKDVLSLEGVRNTQKMTDLLKMIAYQTGKEVSNEELGRQLGLSKNTVEKYLELLSRIFIIFKLPGFSRNQRKEITRNCKWYFYDNGIRNALTGNFDAIALRQDIGEIWENYLLSERLKKKSYNEEDASLFFWRTYDQQEIDVIEQSGTQLKAFEIKWNDRKTRIPVAWKNAYPVAEWKVIDRQNYLEWIT